MPTKISSVDENPNGAWETATTTEGRGKNFNEMKNKLSLLSHLDEYSVCT